jgi:hypothetical protein
LNINIEDHEIESIRIRVAEKLGWRGIEYGRDGLLVGHPPGRKDFRTVPSFCRDIKAAWEIISFLTSRGLRAVIDNQPRRGNLGDCRVEIIAITTLVAKAAHASAALAICLAFLGIPELPMPDVSAEHRSQTPPSNPQSRGKHLDRPNTLPGGGMP